MIDKDAIRARCEAATKGPWYWGDGWNNPNLRKHDEQYSGVKYADLALHSGRMAMIPLRIDHYEPEWDVSLDLDELTAADREFIAHAREDIPALLAEVERLEGLLQQAIEGVTR